MKSNVSDFLELVTLVYKDAVTRCAADVSDLRDLLTLRSRVEREGLSFMTITLSNFSRDFERSLEIGKIDSTLFHGFKRVKSGSIPAFLQGMTSLVFDRRTGEIHDPHNGGSSMHLSDAVESIRQFCRFLSKVQIDCAPERVSHTIEEFVKVEQSFSDFSLPDSEIARFRALSDVIWANLLLSFDSSQLVPRHGPGATAERVSGNQKYLMQRWHDRLEPYFPLVGSVFPIGIADRLEELDNVTIIPQDQEQPVRIVTVPKTLKGPRVIAIEPVCQQFAQQAVKDFLYEKIESYWLTSGHVNFTDQSINQSLAISASVDQSMATIDLSEASDRVPLSLVKEMFSSNQDFLDHVLACRSQRAELPDGRVIDLQKFASMGSALCFPVEAMYFYTICVKALLDANNLSYTPSNVFTVTRDVYVYGDDIIVPTTNAATVLDYLQLYNCKVNTAKTFYRGSFRESCGVDAYGGIQVTPVYLRQPLPENRQDASSIISTVSTANQLYKKGYWHTADFLFRKIESIIGPLPYVGDDSEAIGRISFLGYRTIQRWNPNLHRFEVKALVAKPIYRTDRLDGYAALAKCLRGLESVKSDSIRAGTDLERSALRGAVTLKRRWVRT